MLLARHDPIGLGLRFVATDGGLFTLQAAEFMAAQPAITQRRIEAGFLPGLNNLAFDVSDTIDVNSWYGALLKGVFNFSPATTKLEAAAWLLYAIPVMTVFLLGVRRRTSSAAAAPQPRPVRSH
jgi:high-affinity iron transporter